MPDPEVRLLDRERELEALAVALTAAGASRGSLVVVEGHAGTGKSALVGAAAELAGRSGVRVLGARGGELEQDHAFGIIRQLYGPALDTAPEAQRARVLAGAAAPAARVLGLEDGGMAAHAAGFATMHALYWLTAGMAVDAPLLATVDDAHWADASSLRALDYLARRLADLPVLIVVAFRPDEPGAGRALLDAVRGVAATRLSPRALRPESVARIVRGRFPDADPALCEACHGVTAGNPLYLEEVLRAVRVDGVAPRAEDVRATSVRLLGDRVIRRVERVDPAAPPLARALAVLGSGARLATAAELADVPFEAAVPIAHELRRIEVLATEDPAVFVHPLIRSSIYDAIPEAERYAAHRRAAALLAEGGTPAQIVASHLSRVPPAMDDAVARTLQAAAADALDRAAPDEAAAWLERALAEGAASPTRAELLVRLGTARALLRDPAAIEALRAAFDVAEDAQRRAQIAVLLAELLAHAGQWAAAAAVIESADGAGAGAGDSGEHRAEIAAIKGAMTLFDPAGIDGFDGHHAEYARLAQLDHWASRALATLLGVEAMARGRPQEALALAEGARRDGRLLGERGAGSWASPQLLSVYIGADDLDRASVALDELDAAARTSGSVFGLMTALIYRAWLDARLGNLAEAEADVTAALAMARDANLLMGLTTTSFLLVDVLLERPSLVHIEQMLEQTVLPPDFLATASGAMLLEARGRLRLLHRDGQGSIADLREAGRILSALRFGPLFSTWRSALALALPGEDRDEALDLATTELDLSRATGLARVLGISLRTLGILRASDDGIDLLRESVAVLEGSPARLDHARSLVELGAALRRTNRRGDSRAPLMEGLQLARACGAERLAARAERELQASGGRRVHLAASGRGSLTASELRVAELAVASATNSEIAQELYVSLKTVETHLSHAYAKLGLAGAGSRRRLSEALGHPGTVRIGSSAPPGPPLPGT